jgi:hypothetical protein
MGQPASTIDWSEVTGEFRADSAIRLRSELAWEPGEEEAGDDEATRPYLREALPLPVRDPVGELDRATGCAVARLGSLLEWIAEEDPTSDVVSFVRAFLVHVGALNQALDSLASAVRASASVPLRTTAEAFARAAAVWRANIVDHVDELALTQRASLDGWSSLPEYSAMYVLAFVMPSLNAVKEWTVPVRVEALGLGPYVAAVEDAVVEINWMLRSAAAEGAIGDAAQLETAGRAIAW